MLSGLHPKERRQYETMFTISNSTKHFRTLQSAINKAIHKQHVHKITILFYYNHNLIGKLDKIGSIDFILGSNFITHFEANEIENAKKFNFFA